ncbi:acyltransferase [Haloechinothrix salitolerans]|uniref:acyltransferase n=1 Tax=Haloechinothrix salitolerans TaxID=926830 RepID=UPI0031EDF09E
MNIAALYAAVYVDGSSVVGEHCTLGFPKEARVRAAQQQQETQSAGKPVVIGQQCLLANHVVLYEGVQVGRDCFLEDRVRVGYDSTIGDCSRIVYGAYVCDRVTIGVDARVAGFVCDGSVIADRCTVMGELVHEYTRPHRGWWEVDEDSPTVEPDSVVGYGSRVVGGVTIGPRSYVAAGAIVTKDVPPEHVVTGVNVHTPANQWAGGRLQDLIRYWTSHR